MRKHKVLIVDDEQSIRETISFRLSKDGYETINASSGEEALEIIEKEKINLVILDIILPGIDGNTLCTKIKVNENSKDIPILILSEKSDITDQIHSLEIGADDYLTKPFSAKLLSAKVKAILRRCENSPLVETQTIDSEDLPVISYREISMNPNEFTASINDIPLHLTAVEYKLLYVLLNKPGHVYSRERILEKVRGDDVIITGRTVDVHILSLRRKLDVYAEVIETVRGVGYKSQKVS